MAKRRIYIAGPITVGDQFENVGVAIDVANGIAALGCVPFVPHLCALWQMKHPHGNTFWMAHDLEWLTVCHAVLRIPGYSKGADEECRAAQLMGLPVFHSVPELRDWLVTQEGR